MAFHKNVSDALVETWSSIILQMQEDGTLQRLKTSFIFNPTEGCQARSQASGRWQRGRGAPRRARSLHTLLQGLCADRGS